MSDPAGEQKADPAEEQKPDDPIGFAEFTTLAWLGLIATDHFQMPRSIVMTTIYSVFRYSMIVDV
jgi:hypothetical protein